MKAQDISIKIKALENQLSALIILRDDSEKAYQELAAFSSRLLEETKRRYSELERRKKCVERIREELLDALKE